MKILILLALVCMALKVKAQDATPRCQNQANDYVQRLLGEDQAVKTSYLISAKLSTDQNETVQVVAGQADDGSDQSIGYLLVMRLSDCSVLKSKKGFFHFRD